MKLKNKFKKFKALDQNRNPNNSILANIDGFVSYIFDYGRSEITARNVLDSLHFYMADTRNANICDLNNCIKVKKWLLTSKNKRSWSNNTMNSYRKNLISFLNYLYSEEIIAENNLKRIPKGKPEYRNIKIFDYKDCKKLIPTIETIFANDYYYLLRNTVITQMFIMTGCRPIEIVSLEMDDYDANNGELYIQTRKNGSSRSYTLPVSLRSRLESYLKLRSEYSKCNSCALFLSKRGMALKQTGLRKLFDKVSKHLNRKIKPKDMRRFVASNLESQGLELEKISKHLGHKSTSTTKLYLETSTYQTNDGIALLSPILD